MTTLINIKGFVPTNWLEALKNSYTLHTGRCEFVCHSCRQTFKKGCHYLGGGKWRKICPRCFLKNFDWKMKETYKQIAEWINFIEVQRTLCEDKKISASDMMRQLKWNLNLIGLRIVNISFETLISNVRNCFRVSFHSFKKQFVIQNLDFDSCNGFHSNKIDGLLYKAYAGMSSGGWQFLSTLKSGVSLPYTLWMR